MTLSTAIVTEGVSRTRNALINGSLEYDWDNGYCCHQVRSRKIRVGFLVFESCLGIPSAQIMFSDWQWGNHGCS